MASQDGLVAAISAGVIELGSSMPASDVLAERYVNKRPGTASFKDDFVEQNKRFKWVMFLGRDEVKMLIASWISKVHENMEKGLALVDKTQLAGLATKEKILLNNGWCDKSYKEVIENLINYQMEADENFDHSNTTYLTTIATLLDKNSKLKMKEAVVCEYYV